jgi:hypothetical protein
MYTFLKHSELLLLLVRLILELDNFLLGEHTGLLDGDKLLVQGFNFVLQRDFDVLRHG